jgi:hypothetical protein
VSTIAAHATARGIEPAPKPGFAGAAALDAGGHLAGMVDIKPVLVVGSGAPVPDAVRVPAAVLVPAATIRAFLQAQGVVQDIVAAADGGHAALDQSVLRVICVRK